MKVRSALVATLLVCVGAFVATPAHAAEPAPDYVRTAFDGTIYEVTDDDAVALSFGQWAERGFPAFAAADTVFVKVLSFNTVTAVTDFARPGLELTSDITWEEYRAAGFPAIETVAWGPDISVHKWGTSPELLAQDPAGQIIKLSYAQWRDAGFPAYTAREGRGFVRLSWDAGGGIAYMCDTAAGKGGRLTYEQWTSLGSPTPLTVTRTANDNVRRIRPGSTSLSYVGAMNLVYDPWGPLSAPLSNRALSYSEWVAMGSPTPTDSLPEAAWNLGCDRNSVSAWA